MRDLVIAIGQTLRRDDGAAAVLLQSVELPESCIIRVLPQLLPELVDDLARASRVLFVDAAVDRSTPTLEPVGEPKSYAGFSHFATPAGLMELCRKLHGHAPYSHLLRLPAFDLGFGEGLSEPLQAQLQLARTLLEQWFLLQVELLKRHRSGAVMDFPFPLSLLEEPATYPQASGPITVKQTHISVVVLMGEVVYKLRKPIRTPFLDFTTLEQRLEDCHREVELNRRLAAEVYLGVVPVVRTGAGIVVDPVRYEGEVLEWAVKMSRLPAEATLAQRLPLGEVTPAVLERLARHIAAFHQRAEATPTMAAYGRSERVLQNALDNFTEALAHPDGSLHPSVLRTVHQQTERVGRSLAALMEQRVAAGMIRDTHGDLHLDHIYWFPSRQEHEEFVIIDCVEFNEAFRYADPVADVAFTCMDLGFRGRRDLAKVFAQSYFEATQDEEGRKLLPFYTAYRAAVRAKVESIQASESEVPLADRVAARQRATAHWLYALGELSEPNERPALILFGGLPGSGKSTLARALLESGSQDTQLIRTDVVRRDLHAETPELERYGLAMTELTYKTCLAQAREALLLGRRVFVDANFPQESWREQFFALADSLGVPSVFVHCAVADPVARLRLAQRTCDASEADVQVYEKALLHWEPLGVTTHTRTIDVNTDAPVDRLRESLVASLRERGLA